MSAKKLTVVISGASGWIGSHLSRACTEQGHQVIPISRARHPNSVFWDPAAHIIDLKPSTAVDVWVNLAGTSIAGRWSAQRRRAILTSRVKSTELAVNTILKMDTPPKRFISISACGYYGDKGDELVTEASCAGTTFLSNVCLEWEHATQPLSKAGVEVVLPRLGTVLGRDGGAWPQLLQAARYGAAAYFGSGQQWWPWIGLEDCVQALVYLVGGSVTGVLNLVAPHPVRQRDAMKILSSSLHRPCWRCPKWVIRMLLGEMADNLLLTSCKVRSAALLEQLTWQAPSFEMLCQTLLAPPEPDQC